MRFLFFLSALFVLHFQCHGAMSNPVLHKAKFVMKDGSSRVGLVFLYDEYCPYELQDAFHNDTISKDVSFQALLNCQYYLRMKTVYIPIYHSLERINIKQNKFLISSFLYTDSNSVHITHLDSIKYTVYLGMLGEVSSGERNVHVFSPEIVEQIKFIKRFAKWQKIRPRVLKITDNTYKSVSLVRLNPLVTDAECQALVSEFVEFQKKGKDFDPLIRKCATLGVAAFIYFEGWC